VALGLHACGPRCDPKADYEPGDRFRITVLDGPVERPECAYAALPPGTTYEVEASKGTVVVSPECPAVGYWGTAASSPPVLEGLGLSADECGMLGTLGLYFVHRTNSGVDGGVFVTPSPPSGIHERDCESCSLTVFWTGSFDKGCSLPSTYPIRIEYIGHNEPKEPVCKR